MSEATIETVEWGPDTRHLGLPQVTSRDIARKGCILRGLVGSTVHGLGVNDGVDDRDEMGVCCEPRSHVIGLSLFEQYVYRTKPEGVRSGPGDLDLQVFSLRKWMRLAAKGNPTIALILFVPEAQCNIYTPLGAALRAFAPSIINSGAGKAYLGYMEQQRQRLTGLRGQKNVNRPELVALYGYDTKYAMHMLRLGFQGLEMMQTGRLTLPMPEPERTYLREVRQGQHELNRVLTRAGELEAELRDAIASSPLPQEADYDAIDRWLCATYSLFWHGEQR